MARTVASEVERLLSDSAKAFPLWEVTKDVVDEFIDLSLNYRQSGHPGGSRSKVHLLLALMLSGAMRHDLVRPWRRFGDRFILSAGHTVPLIYATLATLNEAMRVRHERTHDERFAFPFDGKFALTWEDLLGLRRHGGLPGHAEMAGKTLFLKWNTGPSGHGMPPTVGQAVALKIAGAEEVKVFAVEGEGGLTPGASHETRNSAWGLGLSNLVFLLDWNDFGIDVNAVSSVVHGGPRDWFEPYGWRVVGTEKGSEWDEVTRVVLEAARGENPAKVPSVGWFRTRKGRGYLKYDYASHGTAHTMNHELFWQLRKDFQKKYGVEYEGVDQPAPKDAEAIRAQARRNLEVAASVLHTRPDVSDYLSDRLSDIANTVPDDIPKFFLGGRAKDIFKDERIFDYEQYPEAMWAKPGEKKPNRAALAAWGSWVNTFAKSDYGRPLFIAMSADLAESTNIAGFMKGFGDAEGIRAQARRNLEVAASVLRSRRDVSDYLSDRLSEIARTVPDDIPTFFLGGRAKDIFKDERIFDYEHYPEAMWAKPGEKKPNRAALATWGSWVNTFAKMEYGRPLFIAMSADLAESTNISGFMKGFGDVEGWGWYQRDTNIHGALLPQQITEFTNSGIACGIASVNLAEDPFDDFNGFWGACSTYGAFSYLKYGEMRLFSQLAQDCELRVGKVLWIAGHSGPETAEDSRTHFGIFETGVTQLFPDGAVIDLHPWEYNEVPVVLGAALRQKAPIVALHLTRPNVDIPDRKALGMDSHFAAARGAYFIRRYRAGQPRMGTIFVQGTSTTANLVKILPKLDERGLNVKIVAAISPQLFALQDQRYRDEIASAADRVDAMVISNRSRRVMRDWIEHPVVAEYSLTSDWDDRWRTGGTVDEVIAEAHLSPQHLLAGIERFAAERKERLRRIGDAVDAALRE